ncbi:hypothetical protein LguiB_018551 [Lonicera macranthoides]
MRVLGGNSDDNEEEDNESDGGNSDDNKEEDNESDGMSSDNKEEDNESDGGSSDDEEIEVMSNEDELRCGGSGVKEQSNRGGVVEELNKNAEEQNIHVLKNNRHVGDNIEDSEGTNIGGAISRGRGTTTTTTTGHYYRALLEAFAMANANTNPTITCLLCDEFLGYTSTRTKDITMHINNRHYG